MRKIDFQEPSHQDWKRWRVTCKAATGRLINSVRSGRQANVRSELYRKQARVYKARNGAFHGKCAYCESRMRRHDDLDHFRPCRAVTTETTEKDRRVRIRNGHGAWIDHPGYYWLAYSWRNLLPSCSTCNRALNIDGKRIGKRTRFPVRGFRATRPGEESQEKPLLINPAEDEPEKHFVFDKDSYLLLGLTKRGKTCIRVFGLHEREELREAWKKTYDDIIREVGSLINPDVSDRKGKIKALTENIKSGRREYSFVALAALQECSSLVPSL